MLSKSLIWFSAKNHCKMILKKEPLEEIAKSTTETGEKQDKPEASCIGRTEGISHERGMDEACQKDKEVSVKIS